MKISSYSSPFNFGHKALEQLFNGTVIVQEKVDGSQISFSRSQDGTLSLRSRNTEIICSPETSSMFNKAVQTVLKLQNKLTPGYTYRGEFLAKPKHNTLCYECVPRGFIVLFDIDKGDQDYMMPEELAKEANRLGLESVPHLATFTSKPKLEDLKKLLETESILGGVTIEGIVMKNYSQFDEHSKKTLMGKYVSDKFKEKHTGDWKKRNPSQIDVVMEIIEEYCTETRWLKAIQHLKEAGKIEGVVQDISLLIREVPKDILQEDGEEIKERLFKYFWSKISRGVTRGLPEFYKNYLVEQALEDK